MTDRLAATLPHRFRELGTQRLAAEILRAQQILAAGEYGCTSKPKLHTPGTAEPRRCSSCNTRELALLNFIRRPDSKSWGELLQYTYRWIPAYPEPRPPEPEPLCGAKSLTDPTTYICARIRGHEEVEHRDISGISWDPNEIPTEEPT